MPERPDDAVAMEHGKVEEVIDRAESKIEEVIDKGKDASHRK
jgi:hypothetical protein